MGLRFDGTGRVTFPVNNIVLDSAVGWTIVTKVKFQGNTGTAKERLWELQVGGALTNQLTHFIGNDTTGDSWIRNAAAVIARFNSGTTNGVETSALSFTSADYGVYFIRKVGATLEVGRCMPAGSVQKASKTNVQTGNLSFLTPLTLGASTDNLKDGREMKEWGVIGRLLTDAEIQQYTNDTATFSDLAGANQVMYAPLSEGVGTTTVMQSTAGNQTGTISGGLTWVGAGGTAPTGTVTVGTIVPNSTGASVPFTYNAADQTGFEYRINGGTAVTGTTSPQVVTGLSPSTAYTIEIRAINASGAGAWSNPANFTTSAATTPITFSGTIPNQSFTNGQAVSVNLAPYFSGDLTPFTFARTGAALTGTGLSITSAGLLTGTATTGSVTGVTITGTDSSSNTAVSNAFNVTVTSGDVTAPTFTVAPAVSGVTQTGGTATAQINETGSIFYVVVPQAQATPSVAQVIAGQNASGTAPIDSGSAVNTTTLSDAFTGLTAGTAHKACFVARDDEPTPNVQSSVTVVNFNAAAAPVGTITIPDVVNNSDTPWTSAAVDTATVMPINLGSVVVNKTGLSTTAGASLTIADAAIVTGTEYVIIIKIGTAYGWYRAVAT